MPFPGSSNTGSSGSVIDMLASAEKVDRTRFQAQLVFNYIDTDKKGTLTCKHKISFLYLAEACMLMLRATGKLGRKAACVCEGMEPRCAQASGLACVCVCVCVCACVCVCVSTGYWTSQDLARYFEYCEERFGVDRFGLTEL